MRFRVVFFVMFSSFFMFSQEYMNRLELILSSEESDSIKMKKTDVFFKSFGVVIDSIQLANCYHEYGKWFFKKSRKKDYELNLKKAIFFTEKSLELKKRVSVSTTSQKKTLYNLGVFYTKLNNKIQAINHYQQIIDFSELDIKTLAAYRSIANIYIEIGDYHKAIENLDHLIDLSLSDSVYTKRAIDGFIYKADVLSIMGWKKHSEQIKENLIKFDSLLHMYNLKESYYNLRLNQLEGNRLLENGFYKEALPFFEEVLKSIPEKDSLNLAIINNSIGSTFKKLKKYEQAKEYLQKAITYDVTFSPIYENLGDLYVDEQAYQKAIKAYQQAINTQLLNEIKDVYENIPVADLGEVKNKYYLLHHLIQKAKGWLEYYQQDKDLKKLQYALATFETADKLIDIIRFESTEYKSKLYWREQGASLYQGAVAVCYLLNQPEKAFYFIEKNKAILLLEDISNHQAIKNANVPLELAQKEEDLKREIHQVENKLQQANTAESATVKRELYLSKRKFATFVDSLIVAYPNYANYKKNIPILSYKEAVAKYASEDTCVLQYIINEEGGFGLLINKNKPLLFKIEEASQLSKEIQEFKKVVTQKIRTSEEQQEFVVKANGIFKKIIPEEVYQQIKGKKVIIVPDYSLQEVSFETLLTSKDPTSFLVKEAEINYAYSLSYLENNNQLIRNTTKEFLGIAPVNFTALQLPTLHYSLPEVTAVKNLFAGESFVDKEATKEKFLKNGNEYAILHLATHASINDINIPWVALHDSKLSLEEIYAYKNQHEIVTLSACETSLGKMQEGEGVLSLARGFFYGGAKSVVSSLWATNDKSNQEISINFYKELKNGLSKSAALRLAKLNYLNTHEGIDASPFYWGGLILIGDSGKMEAYQSFFNTPSFLFCVGILLIILLWLFFKFRKSKTT